MTTRDATEELPPYHDATCGPTMLVRIDDGSSVHVRTAAEWLDLARRDLSAPSAIGEPADKVWIPAELWGAIGEALADSEGHVPTTAEDILAAIKSARVALGDTEKDAARFRAYFDGERSSAALIDLELRVIAGGRPTLDEWRSAVDDAISAMNARSDS